MSWESSRDPSEMEAPPAPPPPPRPGGIVSWNVSFALVFALVWGGIGLVLPIVFFLVGGAPWNDAILDRRGVTTTATPISVTSTGSRVNRRSVMRITFQFVDSRGAVHDGSVSTAQSDVVSRAQMRQPIPIEYDPQDPERLRAVGDTASVFPPVAFLPGILGIVGTLATLFLLRAMARTRAIYKRGTAALARVDQHEATASTQNKRRVIRMHYAFAGTHGTHRGSWKTVDPAPVGAVLWVLYDPARPDQNVPFKGWPTAASMRRAPPRQPDAAVPRIWS